jgi:hypothetical protein
VLRDRGENVPAEITPPVVATVEVSLRDRVSA